MRRLGLVLGLVLLATGAQAQVYSTDTGSGTVDTTAAFNWTGAHYFGLSLRAPNYTTAGLPGTCADGSVAYDTTTNTFKFCEANTWANVSSGIANVVEDTTPQLGGDLDTNGQDIVMNTGSSLIFDTGANTFALSLTNSFASNHTLTFDGDNGRINVTASDELQFNQIVNMNADTELRFGATSSAGYWGSIEIDSGNTPDAFRLYTNSTSSSLQIASWADRATDFQNGPCGTSACTDPTLIIQSADQTTIADWIALWHDQTDGNIATGAGDLNVTPAGGDVLQAISTNGFVSYKVRNVNTGAGVHAEFMAENSASGGSTMYVGATGTNYNTAISAGAVPNIADAGFVLANVGLSGGMILDARLPTAPIRFYAGGSDNNNTFSRGAVLGAATDLTEATATAFARVAIGTGGMTGGEIIATIQATDATDFQTRTMRAVWTAVNKAGTLTVTLGTPEEVVAASTGTLACTLTLVDSTGGNADFKLDCTSSLTQTTLQAQAWILKNFGFGLVSSQ